MVSSSYLKLLVISFQILLLSFSACMKTSPKVKKVEATCPECQYENDNIKDKNAKSPQAEQKNSELNQENSPQQEKTFSFEIDIAKLFESRSLGKSPVIFEYERLKDVLNVKTYEEMFDKALFFYSTGDIELASQIFYALASNSPNQEYKEIALFNLAMSLERLGEDEKAEMIYSQIATSQQYEISSDALLRLARIKISRGEKIKLNQEYFKDEKRKEFSILLNTFQETEQILLELLPKENIEFDFNSVPKYDKIRAKKNYWYEKIKPVEKTIKDMEKFRHYEEMKSVYYLCRGNLAFIKGILEDNYPLVSLKNKVNFILSAQKDYMDVVKRGEPWWVTAAVFKLGETYRYVFEDLATSQDPKELKSDEEKKIYRQELIKELQKALKYAAYIYERNITFAGRIKFKTLWIKRSQEGLETVRKYTEKIQEILQDEQ